MLLACEGASEQGYGRWLNRLADRCGIRIAIDAVDLRGGEPLALVRRVEELLVDRRRSGVRLHHRALLLDGDRWGQNHERDEQALMLAKRRNITLLRQEPVHEAFLLRHFEGFENHRPADGKLALRQLANVWPNYVKGMDATGYEQTLGMEHVDRIRTVEPDFDLFLASIGWTAPRSGH